MLHSPCTTIPVLETGDIVCLRSNPEKAMTVSYVMQETDAFPKNSVAIQCWHLDFPMAMFNAHG